MSKSHKSKFKNQSAQPAETMNIGGHSINNPLRKHAYSNILKNLQPKKENLQIKNSDFHIYAQNINSGTS